MKKSSLGAVVLAAVLLLSACSDSNNNSSVKIPNVVVDSTSDTASEVEQPSDAVSEPAESANSDAVSEPEESQPEEVSTEPSAEPESSEVPVESEPEPVSPPANASYTRAFFDNDLFIGDSIFTGLYLYDKIDMKNVVAAVGYTPYKAYTTPVDLYDGSSMTAVGYAVLRQPERIYIMIGSNGVAAAAAMEESYREMLDKLREDCPDSAIYCISLTPVTNDTEYTSINNTMIKDFNAYIEKLCGEYGITFIDFYSAVLDENGYFSHTYAEIDGLHFKGKTYDLLLSILENVARGE